MKGKLSPGLVFVLGVAVFWVFAIIPGYLTAQSLPVELQRIQKEMREKVKKRTEAAEAGRETQTLTLEFGQLIDAQDESIHSEHMVREAHRVALQAGVRLISIQPLATTVRGDFKKFPVQINVEGNLKGVKELLLLLRDARPLLDPERVTMRTASDSRKITAQLTIASYAWAPKEKAKRRST